MKWSFLIGILAVLFPLWPLHEIHSQFGGDWTSHTWPLGYMTEYFKNHGTVPFNLSGSRVINYAVPVFYGYLLYPLMAFIGALAGFDLGLRIAFYSVLLLQYFLVQKVIFLKTENRVLAIIVACLTVWTIYPLTNLYHRGAFVEYFANSFLLSLVAAWYLIIDQKNKDRRVKLVMLFAILTAFNFGVHPIQALYSLGIIGFCLATTCFVRNRQTLASSIGPILFAGAFALLVCSPWLYAVTTFLHKLNTNSVLTFYPESIDNFWVRFGIFPHDSRSIIRGVFIDTPYLDAQINMPLLILCAGVASFIFFRKKFTAKRGPVLLCLSICCVAFVAASAMSLSLQIYDFLPKIFQNIQMVYRMVSYQNTLLFAIFYLVLNLIDTKALREKPIMMLLAAVLTISGIGVMVKHTRAKAVRIGQTPNLGDPKFLTTPESFTLENYVSKDFEEVTKDEFSKLEKLKFSLKSDKDFGLVEPIFTNFSEATEVKTNASAFNWNKIYINGIKVPDTNLRKWSGEYILTIPPGSHKVTVNWEPDMKWKWLVRISYSVFAIFSLFLIYLGVHDKAMTRLTSTNGTLRGQ